MTYTTDTHDHIGLHGRFNTGRHNSPTGGSERIAFGVYQRPVLDTIDGNHIRQVMGDNNDVTESIRNQTPSAEAADPIEALLNSHPVWSVNVPDTILHLDIASMWRTTWDTALTYTTSVDDRGYDTVDAVSLRDKSTIDAPNAVTDSPEFAFHCIDGQDMHCKTKLLGMTDAPSYDAALREFEQEFTPIRCPSNWEFELVEIGDTHTYDATSFDTPHAK